MRFVVVHNHIYKNAGSTIDAIFAGAGFRSIALEATAALPVVVPERVVQAVAADSQVEFVTSHSFAVPRPRDLEDVGFVDITFLRHPIDRLYSIYTYTRGPGVADFAEIPKSATFAEFIDALAHTAPSHLHSAQTTLLGNRRDFYFPPGEAALARACAAVAETRFLGIVDRLEESFGIFVACCSGLFPGRNMQRLRGPIAAVNRSSRPGALDERLTRIAAELGAERLERVAAANAADLQLFEFANRELTRRRLALFAPARS